MKIIVQQQNKIIELNHREENSILQTLQEAGIVVEAPCGGNGRCGKCRISFFKGATDITKADEACFSEEELQEGFRLACKAFPKKECSICLGFSEMQNMEVLSEYNLLEEREECAFNGYGIAVDIGTTTIALQLIEISSIKVLASHTFINGQKQYGADVISRIQASNQGKKEILRQQIVNDLKQGIKKLLSQREENIHSMVISANTTMIHLLMGYSCETLGIFPFIPENTDTIVTDCKSLLGDVPYEFPIKILPAISAFVGGDIMAGLLVCRFWKKEEISILIDLGTNGELAIGNRKRILVTSTAAGPAFEGGNIYCGIGSVPGAICQVEIKNQKTAVKTIKDAQPCGICGTGVVETVYELLQHGMIDETGLLEEKYFEDGVLLAKSESGENIILTQKDIREIQLAKAAIHAGIKTLMLRYGAAWEDISHVYLAGGFGYKMNLEKAIGIGLLPKALKDKVITVGNTSLAGSSYSMREKDADTQAAHIKAIAEEINLSNDIAFGEYYMEEMYFES